MAIWTGWTDETSEVQWQGSVLTMLNNLFAK